MDISPEEAKAALTNIRQTTTKACRTTNFGAYYPLLWGIIWTIGFLVSQWQPQHVLLIWITVIVLGMIGSSLLGITQGGRMRFTPGSQAATTNVRLGIFNAVLYGFAILWLIVLPLTPHQIALLWVTIVMFSAIIAGVWYRIPYLIGFGVAVTAVSVLGYFLLPAYFYLWEAIFTGLPLIAASLFYLRKR